MTDQSSKPNLLPDALARSQFPHGTTIILSSTPQPPSDPLVFPLKVAVTVTSLLAFLGGFGTLHFHARAGEEAERADGEAARADKAEDITVKWNEWFKKRYGVYPHEWSPSTSGTAPAGQILARPPAILPKAPVKKLTKVVQPPAVDQKKVERLVGLLAQVGIQVNDPQVPEVVSFSSSLLIIEEVTINARRIRLENGIPVRGTLTNAFETESFSWTGSAMYDFGKKELILDSFDFDQEPLHIPFGQHPFLEGQSPAFAESILEQVKSEMNAPSSPAPQRPGPQNNR